MDDRKNERFGRYEILAEIGRGAMGIVYKARDPKINRIVAVKTVSLAGQPAEEEREYRERFFREAEAAGRLSHPGIVTIFDVGEEPETRAPYIVMEYVSGQSLDKLLLSCDGHKLPPEAALQVTLELAEALDCAHAQGVVHRDLKPANILVAEDGHVKIADFGVAKLNLANATLAGRTLGTPAFMSPEQLNGDAVDGRSDLFSLGVILYTALTGYRPFQGNSALTVAFKVVNRDPLPATVLDTELPPGLDYIIARAIAKAAAQRYQRGMEMVLDIEDLQAGREPWSKAKQPSLSGGVSRTANESFRSLSLDQLGGAAHRRSGRPGHTLQHGVAEKLLEKMRGKAFASTFLLVGLLVFGLRVGHMVWDQGVSPQNLDGIKTTGTQPVAAVPAPVKMGAEAIVNKPRRPVPAKGTHLPPKRVARSGSLASAATPAMLEIEVDHKFADAHMSIWVDDLLTYTHPLQGIEKKRLVVFRHVQGHEFHAVQIPPGKHLLRVQVASGAGLTEQSAAIDGEFASGTEKMLRIQFNKSGEMNLSLQ
jgi:serine/threonine protein kinase